MAGDYRAQRSLAAAAKVLPLSHALNRVLYVAANSTYGGRCPTLLVIDQPSEYIYTFILQETSLNFLKSVLVRGASLVIRIAFIETTVAVMTSLYPMLI